MHDPSRMAIDPRILTVGTEDIQFSTTRQTLLSLSMKRREASGWGGAALFVCVLLAFLCSLDQPQSIPTGREIILYFSLP